MLCAKHKRKTIALCHLHSHTYTHTCARSPSYLYSQVNAASSNFFITSPTPLVGWANMGLSGTPGRTNVMRKQGKRLRYNGRIAEHTTQQKFSTVMHFSWTVNSGEINHESAQEEFATFCCTWAWSPKQTSCHCSGYKNVSNLFKPVGEKKCFVSWALTLVVLLVVLKKLSASYSPGN